MQSTTGGGHQHGQQSVGELESYDGSGYGSPLSSARSSYVNGKPLPTIPAGTHVHDLSQSTNGGYGDFDFDASFPDPPTLPVSAATHAKTNGITHNGSHFDEIRFRLDDPPMGHHIQLNTNVNGEDHDVVGRHLLYETALLDTQSFEILGMGQIDELKKEHARLNSRIEAAERKLALENKMRDAAQNINRLYSSGKRDGRPDTPQSPDKDRHSLLGSRKRTSGNQGAQGLSQAEDELTQSLKKVDELNEQIRTLMDRRLVVERSLLRHTAAVLAEQANKPSETWLANGHRNLDDDDEVLGHAPDGIDEFDGIRDILKGAPAVSTGKAAVQQMQDEHERQLASVREQMQMQHEQTLNSLREKAEQQRREHEREMADMHSRLGRLNTQLRGVITETSQVRGQEPDAELDETPSETAEGALDHTLALLEDNMRAMQQERDKNRTHYARVQDSASETRNAVEQQLESLNSQLHRTLQTSSVMEALQSLEDPPEVTGHGYNFQLQYLEDSLYTLEKLLQEHNEQLEIAKHASSGTREAESTAATHAQRIAEYETVMADLWDIVCAEQKPAGLTSGLSTDATRNSAVSGGSSPIREDFSLQAFSARVQHLFDVASGSKEQQDILRRQIQQQRDLNGKSDMAKDREIQELQTRYEALNSSYDATQQDLAKAVENHIFADQQAQQARQELQVVMSELEQLHSAVNAAEARSRAVDERHALILSERDSLGAERDEHKQRLEDVQNEMQDMESELVRLTTELTMSKAELEGAYGTRKERQKEAGASEAELDALAALKDQEMAQMRREHGEKTKLLEQELQDMMSEFQEMTRESLELEKERGQLENLIDSLRERAEQLEAQLSDTQMQWMGVKSPGGPNGVVKESTSVMVLRQEFKKMMRESRAEGLRLLRVSGDEAHRV